MRTSKLGSVKKISGMVVASAIVIGSLGSLAAYAANSSDAVPKNVLLTAPKTTDSAAANTEQTQGNIEHVFNTYETADGSKFFENEHWYNPTTKQFRSEHREYTADHKLLKKSSIFETVKDPSPQFTFEAFKSHMQGPGYIHLGTVTSEDGKELEKLTMNDKVTNQTYISYVDKETGLPVKNETYEYSNGKETLIDISTNVYDYIKDDGTIFKKDGATTVE
ncbi:hypothetical protein M3194_18455 [Paenibacillus glycanilyticus]|uniref:hypothetical protein n=1 Tax=Paenibacillus glycanilyticus TaxID=126569 RepID=UPI002041E935|nr:hypothetical protein [Paenibacillus glycanilyticus]MCM3629331.1 hypothetical protein [Paenibacillus glycanilyticus]